MAEVKITVRAEDQTGGAWSAIKREAESAFEAMEASARNAAGIMQSAFDSLKPHWLEATGTGALKELERPALDAGNGLAEALANGISSASGAPYKALESVVARVRDLLPLPVAQEGPLSDLDDTGPAFINAIADGITGSSNALQSAVQNVFDAIPACIDQTMGQAGAIVQQDMAGISASIDEGMGAASAAAQTGSPGSQGFLEAQTSSSAADFSPQIAAGLDNAASDMGDNFQGLSQAAASVDSDFSSLENDINADYLTDASDMGDDWGGGSGGRGSGRRRRRTGRSLDAGSALSGGGGLSPDLVSQYAQASAGLAEAMNPALEAEFGPAFAQSLQVQYQAQVNAYQEAMGIDTLYGGSGGSQTSGTTGGGTSVHISGPITIHGATNIDGVDGLASQLENAIAQSIQRNTSPITTALKQAGM